KGNIQKWLANNTAHDPSLST
ncbi:hypothetical protein Trydic_g17326, partial [Trypoxylus dichotomus]